MAGSKISWSPSGLVRWSNVTPTNVRGAVGLTFTQTDLTWPERRKVQTSADSLKENDRQVCQSRL